jgi:nucleotide-binding universal stress UspA family protein
VPADSSTKILICFDGSDRAAHAIAVAGQLFPGAEATVVHVWETIEHIVARYAALAPYLGESIGEADASAEEQSGTLAQDGVKLAEQAGLKASAYNATLVTSVWEAVLDAAEAHHAAAIITGTRSLKGVREVIAGTLSHALLQHSAIPLLAIPSPASD